MAKNGRKTWRRPQAAGVRVRATQVRGSGIGITTYLYGLTCEGDGNDDVGGARDAGRVEIHRFVQELLDPPSTDQD